MRCIILDRQRTFLLPAASNSAGISFTGIRCKELKSWPVLVAALTF
jgi:hypothetical protein